MGKRHKWADVIVAWSEGAEIEKRVIGYHPEGYYWVLEDNPDWNDEDAKYRIKPQPKEPQYLYVYYGGMTDAYTYFVSKADPTMMRQYEYIGKIKLEQDDE
jgi:hypothetical protein